MPCYNSLPPVPLPPVLVFKSTLPSENVYTFWSSLGFLNLVAKVRHVKKRSLLVSQNSNPLLQGYGDAVCGVLDGLSNLALEKQKFVFRAPVYKTERWGSIHRYS